MNSPRVLYLVDQLDRGGAAQVVVNTALSLDRSRYSPIVCTTRRSPGNGARDLLSEADIPLIELDRRSRLDVLAWKGLWKALPSVSVLHSHESGSNFWGRVWGRLFRVPVVITQEHTAADEKPPMVHLVERMLSRLSDRIIVVSEANRALLIEYERHPPEKVVTIYNGIDSTRFNKPLDRLEARRRADLPPAEFLIAVIARLNKQKNHKCLLDAIGLLSNDLRSKTQCVIVGSGPLESDLKAYAQRSGLNNTVSFLGERSDIPTILKAIDLLVLPSRSECLPMVILEALASKVPVVATSVGGTPEILGSLNWPMVVPGDPAALASGIAQVACMSVSERALIAENGRRLVERQFTREITTALVEDLYESLLG